MISVIVPFYNVEGKLRRCIDSILSQTYQDYELLLINDGSTDGSAKIALSYYEENSNKIKYIEQENLGVSAARNKGIKKASGDYLCFVDSDDYIDSEYLKKLFHSIIQYRVDISICQHFGNHVSFLGQSIELNSSDEIIISILTDKYFSNNKVAWNKLFKKDLLKNVRFRKDVFLGEDTLFCVEYAKKCNKGIILSEELYHYEESTSSVHYRTDASSIKKYLTYIESRKLMLQNVESLSKDTIAVIEQSLLQACVESYMMAYFLKVKVVKKQVLKQYKQVLVEVKEKKCNISMPFKWKLLFISNHLFDLLVFCQSKSATFWFYLKKIL